MHADLLLCGSVSDARCPSIVVLCSAEYRQCTSQDFLLCHQCLSYGTDGTWSIGQSAPLKKGQDGFLEHQAQMCRLMNSTFNQAPSFVRRTLPDTFVRLLTIQMSPSPGYVAVSRLVILDTRTMHVDISRASGASQAGPGGLPAAAQPRWPPPQGLLLPVVAATEPCRPPLGGGLSAAVAEGPPRCSAGPHCRTTLPSSWPASLAAEHSPAAPATAQITASKHGNEIPAQFGEHPRGGARLMRALN